MRNQNFIVATCFMQFHFHHDGYFSNELTTAWWALAWWSPPCTLCRGLGPGSGWTGWTRTRRRTRRRTTLVSSELGCSVYGLGSCVLSVNICMVCGMWRDKRVLQWSHHKISLSYPNVCSVNIIVTRVSLGPLIFIGYEQDKHCMKQKCRASEGSALLFIASLH